MKLDFDPYQILGLKKTAFAENITKAFRKAARKHHSDRGGDRTAFERVKLAYKILGDPARRKVFDETGEYDDSSVEKIDSQAMQVLCGIFLQMLHQGFDGFGRDVLSMVRQQVKSNIGEQEQQIASMESERTRLEKAISKIRRKSEGENILAATARNRLNQLDEMTRAAKDNWTVLKRAATMADDYEWIKGDKASKPAPETPRLAWTTI